MYGPSGVGLLMYVNTLNTSDRNLLDMMICCGTIISIIKSIPLTVFMIYRNIFGPIQNQNLVIGILCIGVCGNVAYCLFFLESIFIWYITEKEFNIQVKMDEIGMAQCLLFFNTTWAFGLTFLISDVGYIFHQHLTRYTGFPLDLNEKYLIVIRYLSQNCSQTQFKKVLIFRWFIVFCIITWLFFLLITIHKAVNYCMKHFRDENDQDYGEDIGTKFLLCLLDFWVQVT